LDFCSKYPMDKKEVFNAFDNVKIDIKNEDIFNSSTPLKHETNFEVNDMDVDIPDGYDDNFQNDDDDEDYDPNEGNEEDTSVKIKIKRSKKAKQEKEIDLLDTVERKKLMLEEKLKKAEIPKKRYRNKKTGKEGKVNIKVYDGSEVIPGAGSKHVVLIVNCQYCEESFPTVFTASLHIDICHPEKREEFDKRFKKYECMKEDCGKKYYTVKALHKHITEYHKQSIKELSIYAKVKEEYACEICGRKFRMKDNFDDHMEEHMAGIGTRLFKCDICKKKFHYRSNVRVHMKKNHSESPEINLCAKCGQTFDSREKLRKHKKKHEYESHKARMKLKEVDTTPKHCSHCDFVTDAKWRLRHHMFKEHDEGVIFCDHCGKKCNGKANLGKHIHRHHSNQKVMCKLCGREFTCQDNLTRHLKSQHTSNEEKRHKCPHCGKAFHEKYVLDGHINMHLGLKPFKCEFCGQGYQNKSNLLAHLRKSCKLKP